MQWSDAQAQLDEAVAEIFDEVECQLLPRKRGLGRNSDLVPDPDREEFDFLASKDQAPERLTLEADRVADPATRSLLLAAQIVLTARSTDWPHMPRQHDHVQIGTDIYIIAESHRDGSDRMAFYLNWAS